MGKKTERKVNQLIKLLYRTGGSVKTSCNALGLSRTIFYKWIQIDKKLAKAFEESRHLAILDVEDALFEQAKKGNVGAIVFVLANINPDKWKHVSKINGSAAANELDGKTNEELLKGILEMSKTLNIEMPKLDGSEDVQDIAYEDVENKEDA